MIFAEHPTFEKNLRKFLAKHHKDTNCLTQLKNLLTSHFELGTVRLSQEVLPPVGEYEEYRIYKIYMAVEGISKNDRPRVCFGKREGSIVFVSFGSHIDNYDNRKLVAEARYCLKEYDGATH